ncbi:MAG TPA: tetratricopeptide repeat protein [Burkholderiales bacterium]|nr:tetratricopeptide repeat protein [Burkholderiales bacterium]
MSLINQVLQDLEKRHASDVEMSALPPNVRTVAEPRTRVPLAVAVLAGAVALVAIGAAVFLQGERRAADAVATRMPVPPPATAVPAPADQASIAASAPAPEPPAPAETASRPPAPSFSAVSRLSDELSLVAPSTARKPKPAVAREDKVAVPVPVPAPAQTAAAPAPGKEADLAKAAVVPAVTPATEAPRTTAPAPAAAPEPVPPAAATAAEEAPAGITKQMRELTPAEKAEVAFRKGAGQIREGHASAAEQSFREALNFDPTHAAARQALLGLLLDAGRNADAEQLLRKALEINPRQPRHAMVLARLEVERGDVTDAINTMVGALPYVRSDPEFHAFLAALLQREGRNREAADYYRTALRAVPGNGVWLMGLGMSLRGSNQAAEARQAFQQALDSRQLSPELQEFVQRQLRELAAAAKR